MKTPFSWPPVPCDWTLLKTPVPILSYLPWKQLRKAGARLSGRSPLSPREQRIPKKESLGSISPSRRRKIYPDLPVGGEARLVAGKVGSSLNSPRHLPCGPRSEVTLCPCWIEMHGPVFLCLPGSMQHCFIWWHFFCLLILFAPLFLS